MEKKTGYRTITYRFRLYCEHKEWLVRTQDIYNQVLSFYYEVLEKEPEVAAIASRQKQLRKLELLTIGARGQEKSTVAHPIPYEKVPLYFRRAAANDAIRLHRSEVAGKRQQEKQILENTENAGQEAGEAFRLEQEPSGNRSNPDPGTDCQSGTDRQERVFHAAPMFYKGMYRNFTDVSVELKLWNREKWVWEKCVLDTCKRKLPENGEFLSPVLKLSGSRAMLHVPVREEVSDVRTVKERMEQKSADCICAAAFPLNDCLAVLAVLDREGSCMESLFIRGGRQLAHEKKKLLNRIRKNRASMGLTADTQASHEGREKSGFPEEGRKGLFGETQTAERKQLPETENKYLKEKIRNLSDSHAHRVSRQIVDFCESRGIKIIVVPNYRQGISLNQTGYLSATDYDWIGRRIIRYMRYKAFGKGIVVTAVPTKDISSCCHVCGERVQRFNGTRHPSKNYYGGKNYICPNGHRGNAGLNTALNVGKRFLIESREWSRAEREGLEESSSVKMEKQET